MPVVSGLGFAELAAGSPVMLFWVFSELLLWARTAVLKMANAQARMVEIFMVHSLALALIIRIMRAGSCSRPFQARSWRLSKASFDRSTDAPALAEARLAIGTGLDHVGAGDSLVIVLSDDLDACRLSIGRDCLALALVAVLGTRVTSRRPRHNRPKG